VLFGASFFVFEISQYTHDGLFFLSRESKCDVARSFSHKISCWFNQDNHVYRQRVQRTVQPRLGLCLPLRTSQTRPTFNPSSLRVLSQASLE
jgi:hypothetical protein